MDKTTTLLPILMLVTSLAFGQNAVKNFKNHLNLGSINPLIDSTLNDCNAKQVSSVQIYKTNAKELLAKLSIDSQFRFDSAVWYKIDTTNNQWVYDWKYIQEYDDLGKEILFASYIWDNDSSVWIGSIKRENEYTQNGKKSIIITYKWDNDNDTWIKAYKSESVYDINGLDSLVYGYDWDHYTKTWIVRNKYVPVFNYFGNAIAARYYYWNYETYQWVFYIREEAEYSAYGKLLFSVSYYFEDNGKWVNAFKSEYIYDNNGNNILYIGYIWDFTIGQWINSNKIEYVYDTFGNETSYSEYSWNIITNQWKGSKKGENEYIENGSITNSHIYDWNETNSDWNVSPCNKVIYYYEGQNFSSANQLKTESIRVYPNPATEYLSFHFEGNNNPITFQLFDLQGKMLLFEKIKLTDKVSLKGIKRGTYLYNFTIGSEKQTGKLLIE